jgi:predicted transcriptional regulator
MDTSATAVRFDDDSMWVELSDGRTLGVPYAWFPRLLKATPKQRKAVEIGRFGLHWEDIDEDISIAGLLAGRRDQALKSSSGGSAVTAKPAVDPKKSITSDYIICLEDGRKFKSLKRHLRTQYNLSPEEYREKWGLPSDYPMLAPAYAKARSALAKQRGLGQQRRRRA